MIEVRDLVKRFGSFEALRSLDFEIAAGESVGLLGENGAGKTTTMRILAGFLPPSSGTVKVAGKDVVFESAAVRRKIGYLPESVPLYGDMRVAEFLRFRARIKGLSARQAKASMARVLDRVQLTSRRRSLIKNLSKGLRQRVGLADALVHSPELLILDEPTSGLDPSQRLELRSLIGELQGEHTLLISSHILPEVEATCERVVVVHRGQVATQVRLDELAGQSDHDRYRLRFRRKDGDDTLKIDVIEGAELLSQECDDDFLCFEFRSPRDHAAREGVLAYFASQGRYPFDLRGVEASLEDLFVNFTHEEGVK